MTTSYLRHGVAALALLTLAAPAAHADAPAPAPPSRAAAEAPPLFGIVQDAEGRPLPSARVVLAELGRVTTTAADGTFGFQNLRPGVYHLDVSLLGYAPEHAVVTVPEDGVLPRVTVTLEASPLALSGLQVTASPVAEDPLRVPQSTTQLAGKELGRNLRASVAQTLAEQPGIRARYAGPGASAPVIRGLGNERILVLQDGQRTGDLSATSSDHGLSVDPLSATQLEVVRGPASLLYGNNALGGVVNVISNDIPTVVPAEVEGFLAGQAESVNPGGAASGSLTLPLGDALALGLRAGGRSVQDVRVGGGGTLENTSFRNLHGTVGLGYVGGDLTAGVAYRGYGFEYGVPFEEHDEHEEHEEHEGEEEPGHSHEGIRLDGMRHEAVGRADLALGGTGLTLLRAEGTAQWYTHDEVEPSGEVGTTFRLNTQTASLTGRTRFGRLRGAVGASGLFRQYSPEGEEALTPSANSNGYGVFLFQEFPVGRLIPGEAHTPQLQFGARFDQYDIETAAGGERFGPARSRTFRNVSGSVGASVPFGHDVTLSGSVARAFRAPTVEELFSNGFHAALGSFDVGNPELEQETNLGAELVLRARTGGLNGQVSAFYNRISDYIAPEAVGDTVLVEEDGASVTVPLNVFRQDDARLRGVEGEVEAALGGNWVVGAMGDLVRGDFVDGGPLPYMPAARIGGSVRWDDSHYSLGLDVRHAFRQDRVPENELATGAYTLVDLAGGINLIRDGLVHSVTLRADNLLDAEYRDAASRIKAFAANPGRNLSLVYRVLF
ncbi:MAG TPA: TonB-dependent receptor [Longimicrobiaceae bacterium]|nr:TonB-dependent receptor [Longimicrobiaceae bacterium]